jgi:hypothetical protein
MAKTFNAFVTDDAKLTIEVSDNLLAKKGITEENFQKCIGLFSKILINYISEPNIDVYMTIENGEKQTFSVNSFLKGEIGNE